MMRWLIQLVAVALFLEGFKSLAAPARRQGEVYVQPDGTPVALFLKGDMHYSWMTDYDDFTVIKDGTHRWVYAKKVNGVLVSSGLEAGEGNPTKMGLVPNLQTDPEFRPVDEIGRFIGDRRDRREIRRLNSQSDPCSSSSSATNPCVMKHLVVLVQFKDHRNRILPDPREYEKLFNHDGIVGNDSTLQFGSVRDYFKENSNGKLRIEAHVTPWIQSPHTEAFAVSTNFGKNLVDTRLVWRDALEQLERTGFDFASMDQNEDGFVDSISFVHSGVAAEVPGLDCVSKKDYMDRIWSHSVRSQHLFTSQSGVNSGHYFVASGVWSRCPEGEQNRWSIARVGVMAHEFCHNLKLPDLGHIGYYDILADMWGRSFDQKPPMLGAWARLRKGWVEPIRITSSGTFQMMASCDSPTVYRIDHNMPDGEYFLVENRHWSCYYDESLQDYTGNPSGPRDKSGAAIWHVDETDLLGWDAFGKEIIDYDTSGYPGHNNFPSRHYEVALIQGDGEWDIESNVNRGDTRDLVKASSEHGDAAYTISSAGVVLNDGSRKPSPSTRSYAYGSFRYTGITLEFGPAGPTMSITVTLEGSSPTSTPQPTPPPTLRPTSSPTARPTPPPTTRQTATPSVRPTPAPTPLPTQLPTTPPPTPLPPVNVPTGKVVGMVFEDKNANGIRDPGEPAIAGVRVMITDSSGEVQIKVTNSNGEYAADVPVGTTATIIVESTLPHGLVPTSADRTTTLYVLVDQTVYDSDGYMSIKPTQPPSSKLTPVPTSSPTTIPTRPPTPQPITPQPTTKPHPDPTPAPTAGPTPSPTRPPTHQPITPQPAAAPPTAMPTSSITNTETMIELSPMHITRFVLVDAETNSDISGGLYCLPFACTGGAKLMDIRAETVGAVESVKFTISGPVNETRIENLPVWSLFGNEGISYNGKTLPPGSYLVEAQPYSEKQARGTAGPAKKVNFVIREAVSSSSPTPVPPSPTPNPTPAPTSGLVLVNSLVLVDANTNTEIQNGFSCGKFLCARDASLVDVRADVTAATNSVKFTLTGPIEVSRVENMAPFVLFGNSAGNYNGRSLLPGDYTLKVQPYSASGASGRSDGISTVQFTVPDLSVTRFVLVNAATNQDIPGGIYCQPTACTGGAAVFNIRAETAGDAQSVELTLKKDGQPLTTRVENEFPWTHFGDILGDYNDHALSPGRYSIEARAYPLPDAQGFASPLKTQNFTIASVPRKLIQF